MPSGEHRASHSGVYAHRKPSRPRGFRNSGMAASCAGYDGISGDMCHTKTCLLGAVREPLLLL